MKKEVHLLQLKPIVSNLLKIKQMIKLITKKEEKNGKRKRQIEKEKQIELVAEVNNPTRAPMSPIITEGIYICFPTLIG